jgi:uncharacterized membrane protein YeaQ/YmgE (transglycosylase-associated protein family)
MAWSAGALIGLVEGWLVTIWTRKSNELIPNIVIGLVGSLGAALATHALGLRVHSGLTVIDGLEGDLLGAATGALVALLVWHQVRDHYF